MRPRQILIRVVAAGALLGVAACGTAATPIAHRKGPDRPHPSCVIQDAFQSTLPQHPSGGQPSPERAAMLYGGGFPRTGWHVVNREARFATLISGKGTLDVLQLPDHTWQFTHGVLCQ